MLTFKKTTLDDIAIVKGYYSFSTNKTCDNTVGGTFMWRDYFSVEYTQWNETLIFKVNVKYHNETTAFTLPLGKDIYGSIREIGNYCNAAGIPVVFCTATKYDLPVLSSMFKNIQLFQEQNWSDYLYKAYDLIALSGRRYHGQKNHMNHFRKTYSNYAFEEITDANVAEVKAFYDNLNLSVTKDSEVFLEEQKKTLEVLENYRLYGLIGGLLRVDGDVAAFSIGEKYGNVLYIHIEKADMKYRGAYQIVNNEFAKCFASPEIEYINREEDVGDIGLRTSKLSYHPCDIIDKYLVFCEG